MKTGTYKVGSGVEADGEVSFCHVKEPVRDDAYSIRFFIRYIDEISPPHSAEG